ASASLFVTSFVETVAVAVAVGMTADAVAVGLLLAAGDVARLLNATKNPPISTMTASTMTTAAQVLGRMGRAGRDAEVWWGISEDLPLLGDVSCKRGASLLQMSASV